MNPRRAPLAGGSWVSAPLRSAWAGWRKPDPEGAIISDDPAVLRTQLLELRRRLHRAEMERDILKKATAYFANQNL